MKDDPQIFVELINRHEPIRFINPEHISLNFCGVGWLGIHRLYLAMTAFPHTQVGPSFICLPIHTYSYNLFKMFITLLLQTLLFKMLKTLSYLPLYVSNNLSWSQVLLQLLCQFLLSLNIPYDESRYLRRKWPWEFLIS